MSGPRHRILLAIMVYNGRAVIDRALASAALIDQRDAEIDVLVLDDASPEPGFSPWLHDTCRAYGFQYYRSPRNLGIVRNFNLGLGRAVEAGYTHVILSNSDVVYPSTLVTRLVAAERATTARVGAMQAWSNNMSAFSLPNLDPDRFLSTQDRVDRLAAVLEAELGDESVALPCGVGFCIMIPTDVVRAVGIMDPVFGRGYCEETDWCLRARALGFEILLSPAAFVYHAGRASTLEAGLLRPGEVTVTANEAIIDHRYPTFREEVERFAESKELDRLIDRARAAIVRDAAARDGYDLDVSWIQTESPPERLRALINPGADAAHVNLAYLGFDHWVRFDDGDGPAAVQRALGRPPDRVAIIDVGPQADRARAAFPGSQVDLRIGYPTRI
jgi:GT2 family glycosyltransferase